MMEWTREGERGGGKFRSPDTQLIHRQAQTLNKPSGLIHNIHIKSADRLCTQQWTSIIQFLRCKHTRTRTSRVDITEINRAAVFRLTYIARARLCVCMYV